MAEKSEDEKRQWNVAGIAIPAGTLIGLGVGFYTDNIPAGLFIGIGGGFVAMFIGMLILRTKGK